MTRAVWAQGQGAVVVGRDGAVYPPEAWPDSATFRARDQANLLIADNRTRQWEDADPSERARLSRLAWGADPVTAAAKVRTVRPPHPTSVAV